jgi:NAD(P)-dependent dehydrogenase (short-subunit alcohol dehydrogenase family)
LPVAIVAGGARGIGLAVATALADASFDVAVVDLEPGDLTGPPARIHALEIRPGIIRTEMTAPAREKYDRYIAEDGVPMGRWGEPADVGAAVATIARGLLPFATGEIVNVGGGMHLHRVWRHGEAEGR